jgi:putative endonuclease
MTVAKKRWHVYIVRCADGTLYAGVAIDVVRRVDEHNGLRKIGARYTRARRPVKLVYQEMAANRSAACKREYRIKQLSRREKLALIAGASAGKHVYGEKPLSLTAINASKVQ